MFKLRLMSVIVLVPLVVLAILKLPSNYLMIASGVVFSYAAWEWVQMTVVKTLALKLFLLCAFVAVAASVITADINVEWIYWVALAWWLVAFTGICYYPKGREIWKQLFLQPIVGLLMFVPAWLAFNELHASGEMGPVFVLLGCCLIWGADIGAYVAGKLWGRNKLAPKVSPGKTWAGFYGALTSSLIIMCIFYVWVQPDLNIYYALWLALFTVLFAVIGDLVESMLKRVYGYKDSGNIIPGHGGIYDRVDSMLAAFPIYVLGLQIITNLRIMAV